ncbi:Plasmodium exported protein, unknown function [Plasmodium gonderi]|uniref:Uncharacterized protein n=1 Tax=Plasmodium gonderi TaxID=77519 RepID=A0A1Y1JD31_PLAGO|nr:Plasmodium exported protein, unknown function [Plasmodium gonderi]GAW79588.1 Plasmodium exported protein, unknown function [Plasmodium gonderi]
MNNELPDNTLFIAAEIRTKNNKGRNTKHHFTHLLKEQRKISMKMCFKNVITFRFFFFSICILLHLFSQDKYITDDRNICEEIKFGCTYQRKLAEKKKCPANDKTQINSVKKKVVRKPSLKRASCILLVENKTNNRGATTANGDEVTVNGDAATVNGNATTTNSDAKTSTGNATTVNSDTRAAKSDAKPVKGVSKPIKGVSKPVKGVSKPVKGVSKPVKCVSKTVNGVAKTVKDDSITVNDAAKTVKDDSITVKDDSITVKDDSITVNGGAITVNGDAKTVKDDDTITVNGDVKKMRSCLKKGKNKNREKRKVHFADPISAEKIFYKDEPVWYDEENDESIQNWQNYITSIKNTNKGNLFSQFFKMKKRTSEQN